MFKAGERVRVTGLTVDTPATVLVAATPGYDFYIVQRDDTAGGGTLVHAAQVHALAVTA